MINTWDACSIFFFWEGGGCIEAVHGSDFESLFGGSVNSESNSTAVKNETVVVLKLSPNMIGNSDDETNYPHKLLLTNRQVELRLFVKLLLTTCQLILNCQKPNYLR